MNNSLKYSLLALVIIAGNKLNAFPNFEEMGKAMDQMANRMHDRFDQMIHNDAGNLNKAEIMETDDQVIITVKLDEKDDVKKIQESLKVVKKTTGKSERVEITLALKNCVLHIEISSDYVVFTAKREIIKETKDENNKPQSTVSSLSTSSSMQTIPEVELNNVKAEIDQSGKVFVLSLQKRTPTISTTIPVITK